MRMLGRSRCRGALTSSLALVVCLIASGCGSSSDDDPLVTVALAGCLDCSAPPEDVIQADQTTTVTAGGEVSGEALPSPTGVSDEYEFDGYQLAPRKLSRLESALAEIDLAGLAERHPPKYEKDIDSRLAFTVTYEGKSYEIGDPVGENYDDPPTQAALFQTVVDIVDDARTAGLGVVEEIPTLEEMLGDF